MKIKLFITDIDGVWTDGGMYYDNQGNEWKKFNTSDSAGVLFLKLAAIDIAIITGENTNIVSRRAEKLGITNLFMSANNKVEIAMSLLEKYKLSWENVAYIGDDINDIKLLQKVGLSACPVQAPDYIKDKVDWVLTKKGGDGVFREFVEKYLMETNQFDTVLQRHIDNQSK